MNKLTIPALNIEKQYPSEWDEIPQRHATRIGEIMYRTFTRQIDYDMARKLAVDTLIERVNSPEKPNFNEDSVNYWANEAVLADSVKFLFNHELNRDKTENISINPKFCTQLIPEVKIGWRKYYGPKSLLEDLTIFGFKEASWRVGKYAETMEERYLDELFAVLYKKSRLFGGVKKSQSVFGSGFARTLEVAKRVPIGVKFMNYLFFLGCMNWIREENIEIDGQEICFGCLFPKGSSGKGDKSRDDNTGFAGILFQMAESGVFGNMEQVSNVSMWDIFLRLFQIHHQIKQLKQ